MTLLRRRSLAIHILAHLIGMPLLLQRMCARLEQLLRTELDDLGELKDFTRLIRTREIDLHVSYAAGEGLELMRAQLSLACFVYDEDVIVAGRWNANLLS